MSLPKNIDPSKSNPKLCSTLPQDDQSSTQCTTITGVGRSAIAVIAVRGSDASDIVSRCFEGATKWRFSPGQIRYGVWIGRPGEGVAGESVVVTPVRDDHFELHCHGGPAATARIIEDLKAFGATPIDSDDWSLGSERLLIREAQQVLARCITARTAAIAMDQVRGAMLNWATHLLSAIENDPRAVEIAKRRADKILARAEFGTRLAESFRVVLIGPPNVGKSSLLNAMVGFDRSITLAVAGTTRDVLHADTVIDGLPIRLSDTAGIRDSDESIETQGIARAHSAAREADLVLSITEPHLTHEPATLAVLPYPLKRLIRVLNKSDLLQNRRATGPYEISTNALSGEGVEELMVAVAGELGSWMPKRADPVPINDRQASLLGEIAIADTKDQVEAKLRELLGVNL